MAAEAVSFRFGCCEPLFSMFWGWSGVYGGVDVLCVDVLRWKVGLILTAESWNWGAFAMLRVKRGLFTQVCFSQPRLTDVSRAAAISHVDIFEVLSVFFGTKNRGDISKWPLDNTIFASAGAKRTCPGFTSGCHLRPT